MYAGKRLKENQVSKIFSAVIFPTIIATVVATVITNLSGTVIANRTERENLFVTIQNLYIGSNKDWIDSKLGPATFTRIIDNEFCECVYVCDVAIVRAYFETSSNSCKAFFVTAYNLKSYEKIEFPKHYSRVVSGKALGEFSFYDIDFSPDVVFGFTSSGPGRALYGEQYFFYSYLDAVYDFYFIIMDYGTMASFRRFSDELDNFGAEYIYMMKCRVIMYLMFTANILQIGTHFIRTHMEYQIYAIMKRPLIGFVTTGGLIVCSCERILEMTIADSTYFNLK